MKSILNSIKGRLILSFIILTLLLVNVLGLFIFSEVKKNIFESVDHTLHSNIQIIKGLLHVEYGEIELEITEIVSGDYTIPLSGHYYKVMMEEKVLATSPSLVEPNYNLTNGRIEYQNKSLNETIYLSIGPDDEPIRVMEHSFDFLGKPTKIYVAENITETLMIIHRIKHFLLITIIISLILSIVVVFWIVNKSLRPLTLFSNKVSQISHNTLSERIDGKIQANELDLLRESFNGMLDRLQRAFEIEKRIISDASHELKTPISVIKAQCDVILLRNRSTEEYIEAIGTIKGTVENMNKLVRELLSLARLDSGLLINADFKLVSISECLIHTVDSLSITAQQKSIKINIADEDNYTFGNKEMLIEAFLNIIENAIKYGKNGGYVNIKSIKIDNIVQIQIEDNGIGIRESDIEKIFERFYRGDASRSTEGTGLGLSITKAIIESLNGRIQIKSEYGKGSCFQIELPQYENILI